MKRFYTLSLSALFLFRFSAHAQLFIDNGTNGTLYIRNASGGTVGDYNNTNSSVALFVDGDVTIKGTYDNQAAETQFTGNIKLDSTIAGHLFVTTGDEVFLSSSAPYASNAAQRINGDFRGNNDFYNLIIQKSATQLVELASNVEVSSKILFNNSGHIRTDDAGFTNNDGSTYSYEIYLKNGISSSLSGNSTGNGATEKYIEGKLRRKATTTGAFYFPIGVAPSALDGMEAFELNFTSNPDMDFVAYIRPGSITPFTRNILCDVGKDPGPGQQNYSGCVGMPDGIFDWYNLESSMDLSHEWIVRPSGDTSGYAYGITLHPGSVLDVNNASNYYTIPAGCGTPYQGKRVRVIAKDGVIGGNLQPAPSAGGNWVPFMHLTSYIWCQFDDTDLDLILNSQTSFSTFRIHGTQLNTQTALPVELVGLKAEPINNTFIKVSWSTASELNNKEFEVYRSTDGINFIQIGKVNGSGTSSTPHNYLLNDYNVQPDIEYYYKLKQIDFDNMYKYTYIVNTHLQSNTTFSISDIYPNPSDGESFVNIYTPASTALNYSSYNVIGQQMFIYQTNLQKGYNQISLTNTSMAKGTYVIQFECNGIIESKKLVKK